MRCLFSLLLCWVVIAQSASDAAIDGSFTVEHCGCDACRCCCVSPECDCCNLCGSALAADANAKLDLNFTAQGLLPPRPLPPPDWEWPTLPPALRPSRFTFPPAIRPSQFTLPPALRPTYYTLPPAVRPSRLTLPPSRFTLPPNIFTLPPALRPTRFTLPPVTWSTPPPVIRPPWDVDILTNPVLGDVHAAGLEGLGGLSAGADATAGAQFLDTSLAGQARFNDLVYRPRPPTMFSLPPSLWTSPPSLWILWEKKTDLDSSPPVQPWALHVNSLPGLQGLQGLRGIAPVGGGVGGGLGLSLAAGHCGCDACTCCCVSSTCSCCNECDKASLISSARLNTNIRPTPILSLPPVMALDELPVTPLGRG